MTDLSAEHKALADYRQRLAAVVQALPADATPHDPRD